MNIEINNTAAKSNTRIGALDTLRGIALLAMAHYHFTWDLEVFGYLEPGTATDGWWRIYARAIATSFLFLVGFSLYLAHQNGIKWKAFTKRLLMIVAAALVITIATVFAFPSSPIYFGILHNIAAASIIGLLFIRAPILITLTAAMLVIAANYSLRADIFNSAYFYWLGLSTVPPRSNDYVPLIPWLAPTLIGIIAAKLSVKHGITERFRGASSSKNIIATAGRHSLSFYLLHQPILLAIVYILTIIAPPNIDHVENYKQSCVSSCVSQGNDLNRCEVFCGCTLEQLHAENLFDTMIMNKLSEAQQSKVNDIGLVCSYANN